MAVRVRVAREAAKGGGVERAISQGGDMRARRASGNVAMAGFGLLGAWYTFPTFGGNQSSRDVSGKLVCVCVLLVRVVIICPASTHYRAGVQSEPGCFGLCALFSA